MHSSWHAVNLEEIFSNQVTNKLLYNFNSDKYVLSDATLSASIFIPPKDRWRGKTLNYYCEIDIQCLYSFHDLVRDTRK